MLGGIGNGPSSQHSVAVATVNSYDFSSEDDAGDQFRALATVHRDNPIQAEAPPPHMPIAVIQGLAAGFIQMQPVML